MGCVPGRGMIRCMYLMIELRPWSCRCSLASNPAPDNRLAMEGRGVTFQKWPKSFPASQSFSPSFQPVRHLGGGSPVTFPPPKRPTTGQLSPSAILAEDIKQASTQVALRSAGSGNSSAGWAASFVLDARETPVASLRNFTTVLFRAKTPNIHAEGKTVKTSLSSREGEPAFTRPSLRRTNHPGCSGPMAGVGDGAGAHSRPRSTEEGSGEHGDLGAGRRERWRWGSGGFRVAAKLGASHSGKLCKRTPF